MVSTGGPEPLVSRAAPCGPDSPSVQHLASIHEATTTSPLSGAVQIVIPRDEPSAQSETLASKTTTSQIISASSPIEALRQLVGLISGAGSSDLLATAQGTPDLVSENHDAAAQAEHLQSIMASAAVEIQRFQRQLQESARILDGVSDDAAGVVTSLQGALTAEFGAVPVEDPAQVGGAEPRPLGTHAAEFGAVPMEPQMTTSRPGRHGMGRHSGSDGLTGHIAALPPPDGSGAPADLKNTAPVENTAQVKNTAPVKKSRARGRR